jgi:hypothetical protein
MAQALRKTIHVSPLLATPSVGSISSVPLLGQAMYGASVTGVSLSRHRNMKPSLVALSLKTWIGVERQVKKPIALTPTPAMSIAVKDQTQ